MMFCIDTVVSKHLEMFFGDMYDKAFDEIKSRNTFLNGFIVFMTGVMKSYIFAIIFINTRCGNNGTTEVSADIFDGDVRCTKIRFCADVESFRMLFVDIILDFTERRSDVGSQLFEKDFTEGIS